MIDVNKRIVFSRFYQIFVRFIRPVEDNFVYRNIVVKRLIILKTRNYFGPGAFLVEYAANGIDVVCFVRPGKLHLRIPGFENAFGVLHVASDLTLGDDKKWRTILLNKAFYRHTINVVDHFIFGFGAEFIHKSSIHFLNDGSFVS